MALDEILIRNLVSSVALVIAAAPIGRFLILRRMSLVGDAIGHSLLPGAVLGAILSHSQPWAISLGAAISGAFLFALASKMPKLLRLKEDTVFAIFYLAALSIGVLLANSHGGEIHLEDLLFGDMEKADTSVTIFSISVAAVCIFGMKLIFNPLLLDTIEPENSVYESKTIVPRMAFYVFVTILIVGAFQTMGALLAIGSILLPSIAAGYFSQKLKMQIILAAVIGVFAIFLGTMMNLLFGLHQSATVILILVALTFISAFTTRAK